MLKDTLQRIDGIVSRVNTHPDYSGGVFRETYHALREEAEKHSLDIELINEKKIITNKERTEFLKRLDNAWNLLAREGIGNYTISKLGYLIEPEQNPTKSFRHEYIKFGGFNAVAPEEIHYRIQHLVDTLQSPSFHPVVRAANAHLEMVEIHPYMDGNGRAARLLQNFCLQQRNYPVAVIPSGELRDYINVLHKVLDNRYNKQSDMFNPSSEEIRFREFIAERVLCSALVLEKELEKKKFHEVNLRGIDQPGMTHSISKIIKGFGRKINKGVSVFIDKRKKRGQFETIIVKGDMNEAELKTAMGECSKRYNIGYDISSRT